MTNQGGVTGSGRHDLDIWHVKLASGETRRLTLDELDAGFNAGWIDERTLVLPAGAIRWAPLGEVAGLDETPAPVSSTPNSIAPHAIDAFAADDGAVSGRDVPIDFDVALDAESDAEVEAFRPRRGRKILGVMTAMIVVGGLGFAAFQARPALTRALASRGDAPSTPIATTPPPPVQAPAAAAPPPVAVATQAAPAVTTAAPAVLTPAEKKAADAAAAKAKKAALKRPK